MKNFLGTHWEKLNKFRWTKEVSEKGKEYVSTISPFSITKETVVPNLSRPWT